jgi:hypothetical protein
MGFNFKFCFVFIFNKKVVEIVDNSASLFSSSIQNHPICLLVKFLVNFTRVSVKKQKLFSYLIFFFFKNDKSISLDGKSTSNSFVENFLEEVKSHLKQ